MKRKFNILINAAKKLTNKKHHLDFVVATLTIPVLLSVIILNYSNLKNLQKNNNPINPTTTTNEKVIVIPQKQASTPISPPDSCIKDIGNVVVVYPKENQTVSNNPLCIDIKYDDTNYCSVVWSYKINNGDWSEYTGNNPCIYNLPNGNIKFELRIQSTVKQLEENLIRNFIYKDNGLNITPTATASAI